MYELIRKLKFDIDNPIKSMQIPVTVDGIRAVKIRWLDYRTTADGEKTLQLRINELEGVGMDVKQGANGRYLLCIPIDRSEYVTRTYSNFTTEMDAIYDFPINTINELTFEFKINDIIANQITALNPISLEIGFYR
jgi:hypothetical protein